MLTYCALGAGVGAGAGAGLEAGVEAVAPLVPSTLFVATGSAVAIVCVTAGAIAETSDAVLESAAAEIPAEPPAVPGLVEVGSVVSVCTAVARKAAGQPSEESYRADSAVRGARRRSCWRA